MADRKNSDLASMGPIARVEIYSEPRCAVVDFELVAAGVRRTLPGAEVELCGPLLESVVNAETGREEGIALALAGAKVRDLEAPAPRVQKPLPGEVEYERRRLVNGDATVYGLLYDAAAMLEIYRAILPLAGFDPQALQVIFTNQLIGSWESADRRYHARTVICSSPSIVSLSGLVEAPAREPGYYIARRSTQGLGLQEEARSEVSRSFAGDFLTIDDGRLTAVVEGYIMQAAAWALSGEPFCQQPGCRLYNAHWQRELIRAQLGDSAGYCDRHRRMFSRGNSVRQSH